jgi:Xaa-Pro aminopeptidase
MSHVFLAHGFEHAFRPVIASGANAAVIHYKKNNQALTQNSWLLLDVGARKDGYSADVSRSFALGLPSTRAQDVYAAVTEVHQSMLQSLELGMSMRDIQARADALIGEQLIRLGLIKVALTKSIREYFPHAIGHHLGVDVHDSCDYSMPLSAGMVLTVEPGIYIPDEAIGVRIEDDIIVTKQGFEIASKEIDY